MKLVQILIPTIFTLVIGCGGEQINAAVNTPTIQCGMCQKTIEMGLKNVPGVAHSAVDLGTKITKVIFDKEKTDLSKIEKAISGLGYQANETLADPIAYNGLPDCCKIGGMH
tara:strand:+ start:765 stop:1100 length:336 start_codon:yes stop_codon:yes gene_type:complete